MDTNPNFQPPQSGPGGPSGPIGPGGPSGPIGPTGGQAAAPAPKRSKGKLIGLIAVGVVALLVVVLVGSELYLRNHVQNCLSDNIKSATKANDVDVSFSKTPMVLQQIGGKVSSIDIQANGLNGTDGMDAHILLKGVEPSGDNRIDDVTILGTLTKAGIENKVKQIQVLSDPTVNLNTSSQQIEISGTALIFPVTLNLKPTLKDNKVELTASKVSVLGFGVPDDLAQQVIGAVGADIPNPNGLTAKDLKFTDDGISLTYTGQNVLPKDIESSGNVQTADCSVL